VEVDSDLATVKLVDVVKKYGDVVAVDHISFDVGDGEFFALLGPSGCGKTTTLRLIAGLEVPDEGEIYIDNELVNHVHPKDRNVAMVFQNYALYPHMTVFGNIAFPLTVRRKELGITKEDIERRVKEVAKLLQIEDLLDRYPSQLSGGQQQRVALARALVRRPRVWLLDEPLSNLDAKLRVYMRAEIKRLQKKLGITAIYVTHDQVEAMSMADRIAVLNSGRILQVGKPLELYEKPASVFVATFIGSPPINIIECNLESNPEDSTVTLKCPGFQHIYKDELAKLITSKKVEGEVLVGIRPEHISVTKPTRPGVVKGTILVSEILGSEQVVLVEVDGVNLRVKATSKEVEASASNDKIGLVIDYNSIILFDKKTGQAVL
jgi:multiple sugar transport system ATP-binding protein